MSDASTCLFCRLASPKPEAAPPPFLIVAREDLIAFPALHPVSPGHLVVPRQHFERAADLSEALGGRMVLLGARLGLALQEALGCSGYTLTLHDGPPGQPVAHVHLNVIPRRCGDPLELPRTPEADREALADLARRLKEAIEAPSEGR
jgi:diadenosine tetraphosphate (Ap4A) HIT family hydrolase